MPELPEAETIVRGLRSPLRGRIVTQLEVLFPDLLDEPPRSFQRVLRGRSFGRVGRRGKNLVLDTHGESEEVHRLVVNLGMSGRLLYRAIDAKEPPPTHPGVRMRLDNGGTLIYHDPRRFGRIRLMAPRSYLAWSRSLGPEPLGVGFTPSRLGRALARSSAPLRSWLLDQSKVAGVGNIYANEALFLSGLHPETRGRDVPARRVTALHSSVRIVLREAIRARGTTLRDYRTAEGWEGSYAVELRVYGREGLPCPVCGKAIVRSVFGGRSAFHCPDCQPMLGGGTE